MANENTTAGANEQQENGGQEQEAKNLRKQLEADIERERMALNVIKEGKGRLKLETPIRAGNEDVDELIYDFTVLTGQEYIDAMDSGPSSNNAFGITHRQALNLFATAAAKQTERVDARDILDRIGMTDALEGEQLARLFFNASTRAGRLRISKR